MSDRLGRLAALVGQLGEEEQSVITKVVAELEAGSLGPFGFLEALRDLERSGLVSRGLTLRVAQVLELGDPSGEECA